jgi:hypothetical protein
MRQRIAVAENGKTKKMPAMEVMFLRLRADALRGDPKAIKFLLTLYDRYADSPQSALPMGELLAEDRAIIEAYLPVATNDQQTDSEHGESNELDP